MDKDILLEIEITIDGYTEICSDGKSVSIVYFSGNAYSRFFRGKILPCAADTQIHIKGKSAALSARYILEGVDCENNDCKIFIENNGSENNGIIMTKPFIITDSPALKWIEGASLYGRVVSENEKLIIQIYCEELE